MPILNKCQITSLMRTKLQCKGYCKKDAHNIAVRFVHNKGHLDARFQTDIQNGCDFDIADSIAGGFVWSRSPEGLDFWNVIHDNVL